LDLKELGLQKVKFSHNSRLDNIIAKEGDIGARGLLVEFEEGLDCIFYAKNGDKIYEVVGEEVEEGLYEIIYPDTILKKGIVRGEIKFFKDNETLSNPIFNINVMRNLFNLKNGITIVKEGKFDEDIPTTAEGDFEVVGEWARNLIKNSDFSQGLDNWNDWGTANREVVTDENGKNWVNIWQDDEESFRGIRQQVHDFEKGINYTISFVAYKADESQGAPSMLIHQYGEDGYDPQFAIEFTEVSTKPTFCTFTFKSADIDKFYFNIMVGGQRRMPFDIFITDIKFEKGDQATPWTPALEDLGDKKGKQYNLSTNLKKDQYYTLSLDGDFNNDDFIGIWLGNDNFIGYLQDNKIIFKPNEDYDDTTIIVKSLSEEGTINQLSIREVEQ